jgi:SnoaL-like domain
VPEQAEQIARVARRVRAALDAADLSAFGDLLDADVQWGPPDAPLPACRHREEVLAWYRRGKDAGVRARVSEVSVHGDQVLVGLRLAARWLLEDGLAREVELRISQGNVASQRVAAAAGFPRPGRSPPRCPRPGTAPSTSASSCARPDGLTG